MVCRSTDEEPTQRISLSKIRSAENAARTVRNKPLPNAPVATQTEEVNRVQRSLSEQITGDKKNKIVALSRILMPMAETIEQHRRMIAYQAYLRDAEVV